MQPKLQLASGGSSTWDWVFVFMSTEACSRGWHHGTRWCCSAVPDTGHTFACPVSAVVTRAEDGNTAAAHSTTSTPVADSLPHRGFRDDVADDPRRRSSTTRAMQRGRLTAQRSLRSRRDASVNAAASEYDDGGEGGESGAEFDGGATFTPALHGKPVPRRVESMDVTVRLASLGVRLYATGNADVSKWAAGGGVGPDRQDMATVVRTTQTVHNAEQTLLRARHRRGASMTDPTHTRNAMSSVSLGQASVVPGDGIASFGAAAQAPVGASTSSLPPPRPPTVYRAPSVFEFCEVLGVDVEISVRADDLLSTNVGLMSNCTLAGLAVHTTVNAASPAPARL